MFVLAEAMQSGIQASSTPLVKGLIIFALSALAAYALFSAVFSYMEPVTTMYPHSIWLVILLNFIIAGFEESIYRNLLVRIIGNPIICAALFAVAHYFTGTLVLSLSGVSLYGYLAFTFIFGVLMYYLKNAFGFMEVPKAVHFVYLMFVTGGVV